MNSNGLLNAVEVARYLRLNPDVVRRMLQRGDIKGFKAGNRWRVTPESLRDYADRQKGE